MAPSPTDVLILDDDQDLRHALSDLVEVEFGRRVVGAATVFELKALGQRALDCGLCILDVNLGEGEPSGIEALEWLRSEGYAGQIVFLTGHAQNNPQVEKACRSGGIPVLSKPLGVDALLELVGSVP